MIRAIAVHGGEPGAVMAPMAGRPAGEFYPGRRIKIRVTQVGTDETDPIEVREGLVGVEAWTIFDHHQLCALGNFQDVVPEGATTAYAEDVAEALRVAGKDAAADKVMEAADNDPLALYVLQPGIYELC